MFLTEKQTGEVKARACANGSVQREHVAKEEAAAPTVSSEAIFIQGTIFAHENHDVATCNIPGSFLQADNPDWVLMRLDGIIAELMVKVAPKKLSQIHYRQCKRQIGSLRPIGESCLWHDEECTSILS